MDEKIDKELKEKIERSQKILDILKKLVHGELDVSKCLDKKCSNCDKKHPSLDDVIELATEVNDDPVRKEELEKLENFLKIVASKGGIGFFAVRNEDGDLRKTATILREIDVSELLTVATLFVKSAYGTALEMLGPKSKEFLQESIIEAVKKSFNE